jgi:SAM-dependent methyltransferase
LYRSIKAYAPILKGRLLDFGCGSKPYKDLFINATEYLGVDVENPGHDHTKEDIDLYFNGRNLPLPDYSFDAVFCSEVLEHVPDLQGSIFEIKRVLKPNGLLLLTVPFFWMEHEKPHDYRRFTIDGIVKTLETNNFEIIHAEKVSHFTEALFQMWSMYIYSFFANQNKYLRMIFSLLFISPVTFSGLIISLILPRIKTLYLGTCVFARNKNEYPLEQKK